MTNPNTTSSLRICFVGLGVMGFHMAGHLAKAGFQVTVYNRTTSKSERWLQEYSGKYVRKLKDAAKQNVIISCVGDDRDLREIYLGDEGLIGQMTQGSLIIDHTTASADIARQLHAAAAERQIGFIDAPVSGGEQGAINGQLTIMCGGDNAAYVKAEPILDAYAKSHQLLGSAGSGQLTKMVNQIAIAGLIQGFAESLHFAEHAGLNRQQVIDVISKGAAHSWQMENRHKTMIKGEYAHGFAVDLMRKDLGICLQEANNNGTSLPVTAIVDQFYADIQQMGGGRWDTSSLLARLKAIKGIQRDPES